jgi:PTS system fructose-specific IIC component
MVSIIGLIFKEVNMKKIVAVTSCPTGIAHTYMAAEALEEAAENMDDIIIKVESQGSVGINNELTEDDIKEADIVIIASEKNLELKRFKDKYIKLVNVSKAIDNAESIIKEAVESAEKGDLPKQGYSLLDKVKDRFKK